tara:strand:+ start:162 stop:830 length:669 start_codon:yes stop_codon:yes gene_type:complete
MKKTTKIYLIENCYGDPNKVYIGKTKNKFRNHKPKFGVSIKYSDIDEVDSLQHKDWEPIETYWIEQFRQWGYEVMNIRKKGGSGPITHTEEVKKIISDKTKGHKKSKEWKRKLSLSHKGKKLTQETKDKLRIIGLNRTYPDNWGEIIKESHKTKNKDFYKNKKWIKSQQKVIYQFDLNGNFIREWDSLKSAALALGCNYVGISHCIHNHQKSAYGYVWRLEK